MDKKKLQEYINKLREAATPISETEVTQTAKTTVNSAKPIHPTHETVKATVTTKNAEATSNNSDDFYSKYIKINLSETTQVGLNENFALSQNQSVTVEVDYAGLITALGYELTDILTCTISVCARTRRAHDGISVYSLDGTFIEKAPGINNIYTISLLSLFNKFNTANFKFVADWDGTESVFLFEPVVTPHRFEELEIVTPPVKMVYAVGEEFDPTGIVVRGKFSNGEIKEVTDYNISSTTMSRSQNYVIISKDVASVRQYVEVNRQELTVTREVYERNRTNEKANWSDWFRSITSTITVDGGGALHQARTIIKIDKSKIDMGTDERVGIQLMLYSRSGFGINQPIRHFRINNIRYAFNPYINNQIFFVGNIKSGEEGDLEVVIEYDDAYLEMMLNSQNDSKATIYFTHSNNPDAKKEIKSFSVATGKFDMDLRSGAYTYELPVITADSTLLGLKISNIFGNNEGGAGCGSYSKLNIIERFDFENVQYNSLINTHTYTDSHGERHVFDVVFYYIAGGARVYITGDEISKINVTTVGSIVAGYTYNGNIVFVEHVTMNNQVYVKTPEIAANNVYYKQLQNENSINLPVHWLRCGNVYKGFNKKGYLVFIIDEFNNYITLTYNDMSRVISIKNKNSDYINFSYDNDKLQFITDSRGRKIKYTYTDSGNFASSSDLGGPRITKIEFCTVESDGITEATYNSVVINYRQSKINGVIGYSINNISTADGLTTYIGYDDDRYNSRIISISTVGSTVPKSSTKNTISSITFLYDSENNITKVTDDDENQSVYKFDENCNLSECYYIKNNKIANYDKYEYVKYSQSYIFSAKTSSLNTYTPEQFVFEAENTRKSILNNINKVIQSTTEKYTDNAKIVAVTKYTYDDEYRCKIKTDSYEYFDISSGQLLHKEVIKVTNYYDSTKRVLIKTTRDYSYFVSDEEIKDNQEVVEYHYDANGNIIEELNYCKGSAPVSDIFYSDFAFDSAGRISQTATQDGLYNYTFGYYNGTQNIKKISHQGRSDLFYSYNNEDEIAKVSATDNGLENFTETEYSLGEVVKINNSGNRPIEFEYDGKRRVSKVKLNGDDYITLTCEEKLQDGSYIIDKVTSVNANSETMTAVRDRGGSFDKLYYNLQLVFQNNYDASGYLISSQDSISGVTETYTRGTYGNTTVYSRSGAGENYSETFTYDFKGNITEIVYRGSVTRTDTFTYTTNSKNNIAKIVTGPESDLEILLAYDISNRYTGATIAYSDLQLIEGITYYKQGDHATSLPKVYSYIVKKQGAAKLSGQISVLYDESQNIKSINFGANIVDYKYDSLGRLIKEENELLGDTYTYTYDNNGNILSKKINNTVVTYSYEGDKLISYNGQACVYDALGNPTIYRSKTATWVRGKKLISYNGNTFTYDATGRRLSKNGLKFYYDSNGRLLKQSNGLEFYYDVIGIAAIKYNGAMYLCRKDLQGNIIALIDNSGTTVVQYNYDAWGNHKVVDANGNEITDPNHLGNLNPFRYRGYYYDTETGFYFLKTRYYDPEVGRFLNRDSIIFADPEEVNGLNLYAYCLDNPINYIDPLGKFVISIGAALVMLAGGLFASFAAPIIVDAAGDIADQIVSSIESLDIPEANVDSSQFVDSNESIIEANVTNDIISSTIVSTYTFDHLFEKQKYSPKRRGARIRAKSKKEAEEKARERGGGRKPRFHKGSFNKDGKWIGPHFHPNVNKNSPYYHDHYFYPIIFLMLGYGSWRDFYEYFN